ncbi:MAG TPA: hypothetical protein PKD70_05530 [Saprospiraceae bacterium]|nr:hypothetical protein [Saprospiraceae bacterium]HMP13320.1 hypothetical protein [Saprospiraceae bacterium]
MNTTIFIHIIRFIGILLGQVFLLKHIDLSWGGFNYIEIFWYPLFILLLPFRTSQPVLLLLSFVTGLAVDSFYDTTAMHAAALVFTGFIRAYVFELIQPRGGYDITHSPTKYRMGMPWFLRYTAILMGVHLFFYFSVEFFTFVYIVDIMLKTVFSFILSMIFVLMFMFIFNPKD